MLYTETMDNLPNIVSQIEEAQKWGNLLEYTVARSVRGAAGACGGLPRGFMQPDEEYVLKTLQSSSGSIYDDEKISPALDASACFLASREGLKETCSALAKQLQEDSSVASARAKSRDEKWDLHLAAARQLLAACSKHVLEAMERLQTDLSAGELLRLKDASGSANEETAGADQGTLPLGQCHPVLLLLFKVCTNLFHVAHPS